MVNERMAAVDPTETAADTAARKKREENGQGETAADTAARKKREENAAREN